jgi:acetyl esterase/lipase
VDPADVLSRTTDLPDVVVRYASRPDAVVDLFLPSRRPATGGPPPLLVFLHGGFWREQYDRVHARPLAEAFAECGYVVALPEYRRVGGGGGWPTTAQDALAAVRALPGLLEGLGVEVGGTTLSGHSAGGHLALWLATEEVAADRVVPLAPVGDLRAAAAAGLGAGAVADLLGGLPDVVPDRYDAADPATRMDTRPACPVVIVHGTADDVVPVANSRGLVARHPFVGLVELPGVEHFGLIDPLSSAAWPTVRDAVRVPPG